jgi:serine/threonine protein kinase
VSQGSSEPGAQRSRFAIGPLIGSGTFGEVYLARLTSMHGIEQNVAVKLLNSGVDPRSQPVSRMRDEGRLLAGLNHPAILQVMDFCYLDGRIGLVTEFVPGADLDDCIHGVDPIGPRAALQVIGAVADALHAAWESRTIDGGRLELVHRDIKPANIRVTPHGSVKLLDFGIAKSEDLQRETATQQRVAFGTPAYMAPEVLSYEVLKALPSRDVFALGCTLYECLVRERWFEGLDHQTIGRVSNRADRFREWRTSRMLKLGDLDPQVLELLERMLEYDHKTRPSAREVAEQCIDLADGSPGPSLWSWARQRRWPPVSDSSGPWTGRSVIDTQFGFGDDPRPSKVVGRAAAVTDERFFGELAEADRADHDAIASGAFPLPLPRGRAPAEAREVTEPERAPRRRDASSTQILGGIPPVAIAAVALGIVLLAGALLVFTALVQLRPELIAELTGRAAAPREAEAAQFGTAGDEEEVVEVGPTAGGVAVDLSDGKLGLDKAHVQLDSDHDVRLLQPGRMAIRLLRDGNVAINPGEVTVQVRWDGGAYEHVFTTSVPPGQTLTLRCDTERRHCEKDR